MIVLQTGSRSKNAPAQAALRALAEAGVRLSAGAEDLAEIVTAGHFRGSRVAPSGVSVSLAMQGAGETISVSDGDVALINERHSAQTLSADELVVFQDYALSSARVSDRPIQFSRAALTKMAAQAEEGRAVCFDHRTSEIIGATFGGAVVDATVRGVEAAWLQLRWYGVNNDQTSADRKQRLQDCRTGPLRYGSVTVYGGDWDFVEVEGPDGPEYFYLIDDADDLRLMEYSRCYLGASTGAGDHKFKADDRPNPPSPDPERSASDRVLCVL